MLYAHEATVEVRGPFPVDMLRYDSCYPASGEDANAIAHSFARRPREPYRVVVRALSQSKTHWTWARWASFGVAVTQPTVRKV